MNPKALAVVKKHLGLSDEEIKTFAPAYVPESTVDLTKKDDQNSGDGVLEIDPYSVNGSD